MVISILIMITCRRSFGAVDTTGCRGVLEKWPSCSKECVLVLMDFCTWLVIPGHQKHSHNKDSIQSHLWWPAFWWHPFRVPTWCALGTTKSRRSSVSPLGIECRYKAPWWITKVCWFHKTSLPSSLEVCSTKRILRFVCFCTFSQSSTALNIRSSLWALA